jgi:hypothetical protein
MEAFSVYEWDFGYLVLLPLIAIPIFIPLGLYQAVIRYVEIKKSSKNTSLFFNQKRKRSDFGNTSR